MKKIRYFPWIVLVSAPVWALSFENKIRAQTIQIDGTTSTTIDSSTSNTCLDSCNIGGGERRGRNIFHSFSKFNVTENSEVLFEDPGVTNILGRVTSKGISNISFIEGKLGVLGGNANLFLINPNGIIFGKNSSLEVGGAFVATTANSIQFGDQGSFEASISNASPDIPLLTINPSALIYEGLNGAIINNSTVGLGVQNGQSLILVGGDVDLNGGVLNASSGRVELGGLAEAGTVKLFFSRTDDALSLEFPENLERGNVSIKNEGSVTVFGNGGGDIAIRAKDILLSGSGSNGSIFRRVLFAGVQGSDNSRAGNIILNADNAIEVNGRASIFNPIFPESKGIGGEIILTAKELSLSGQSFISTDVFGEGKAGNIIIKSDLVDLKSDITTSQDNPVRISASINLNSSGEGGNISVASEVIRLADGAEILTNTFGQGNAGNISLKADQISLSSESLISSNVGAGAEGNGGDIVTVSDSLDLTGGAQFVTSIIQSPSGNSGTPLAGGQGKGGNITVNAKESVLLSGFFEKSGLSSGLFASTEGGANGPAGNISVKTGTLRIEDGAAINAQTLNKSDGGNIFLNVSKFEAFQGAQVITSAADHGNAGNITLEATERITIAGSDPNFEQRKTDFPLTFQNEAPGNSGLFASTRPGSTGNAGSIFIDPPIIDIRDGAGIAVNSLGTGLGGNINIEAENLTLDDQAFISAETVSSQGGNIQLSIDDLLLLNQSSFISATAGTGGGNGDGGNVDIDANLLLALDGSSITAAAFLDMGGNIEITTQGLFLTPDSEIDASSAQGVDGEVIFNTPETDPSDSTTELSENIDIPPKLAQSCRPGQALGNGQFANVGKGGLPSPPTSLRSYPAVWHDIRPPAPLPQASTGRHQLQKIVSTTKTPPIIEAKGWVKTDQGLMLVAPNRPSSPSLIASGAC